MKFRKQARYTLANTKMFTLHGEQAQMQHRRITKAVRPVAARADSAARMCGCLPCPAASHLLQYHHQISEMVAQREHQVRWCIRDYLDSLRAMLVH